jgi:hypothetical protein
MTRVTVRRLLLAAATSALVLATTAAVAVHDRADDQCAKPVAERTGGWFCYEPAP